MIRQERSVRWGTRGPRPTWWLVYAIAALAVAVVGLVEIFVAAGGPRVLLEALVVIAAFGLITLWRRSNRIALDMGRHL